MWQARLASLQLLSTSSCNAFHIIHFRMKLRYWSNIITTTQPRLLLTDIHVFLKCFLSSYIWKKNQQTISLVLHNFLPQENKSTRTTRTVHTSVKARLTSVMIRIWITTKI